MKKTIILFAIISIIVLFINAIMQITRDEKVPDISDLTISYENIPDIENSFYYFKKASELLYWTKDENKINKNNRGDEYDKKFIRKLINKNKDVIKLIEKGTLCKKMQITGLKGYETEMPYLTKWRKITILMSLESIMNYKSGYEEEAFNKAINIIKYGQKIESSIGCMISYLMGSWIKEYGLQRMRSMIPDTKVNKDKLLKYINILNKYGPDEEGIRNAFKMEFLFATKLIDKISETKKHGIINIKQTGDEILDTFMQDSWPFYLFKPNKTKRMFAETFTTYINDINKYYKDIHPLYITYKSKIEMLLTGNNIGEIFYRLLMPSFDIFLKKKSYESFSVSGTTILIAIKCYMKDNGELPNTLNLLVPKYIDNVPNDPFGGKSMQYSKDKKIIYSVGSDLKDVGGSNAIDEYWKTEDPTFMVDIKN